MWRVFFFNWLPEWSEETDDFHLSKRRLLQGLNPALHLQRLLKKLVLTSAHNTQEMDCVPSVSHTQSIIALLEHVKTETKNMAIDIDIDCNA